MAIELPRQLEESMIRKVESGRCASAADLLAQALELVDDHDQWRDIRLNRPRKQVRSGLERARHGQTGDMAMDLTIEKAQRRVPWVAAKPRPTRDGRS